MSETLKSMLRKAAIVAMVALGLAAGNAEAATLYISEFASGVSQGGTTTAQTPPQIAVADQTVALSGSSALSGAFNSKTNSVTLMCDEGCSVKFGTTNAVTATTSNYLLQQGVYYRYGAAPGWFVAAIANAAGNTATGSGGTTNATIVSPLGQQASAASVSVALSSDGGQATAANQTNANQKTQIVDGSGNVIASTANALNTSDTQATASNLNAQVVGNAANGAADAGNPIKIGGVFNTTQPTLTNTQRGDLQLTNRGQAQVSIYSGTAVAGVSPPGADADPAIPGLFVVSQPYAFNGSTWDRQRSDTAITGSEAVTPQPSSSSGSGLTSVSSSAVESNHVIKASPGNLYGFEVTTGATAGFVFVSNTTTAPTAAGAAIAPVKCYIIAANSTLGISYSPAPLQLSTGITIVFSTTGCFVNTASATAFISGDAK